MAIDETGLHSFSGKDRSLAFAVRGQSSRPGWSSLLWAMVIVCASAASCSDGSDQSGGQGGSGSGGSASGGTSGSATGGTTSTGGMVGSGGKGSGGEAGTGGTGTGGTVGSGGTPATGGAVAGASGSGGTGGGAGSTGIAGRSGATGGSSSGSGGATSAGGGGGTGAGGASAGAGGSRPDAGPDGATTGEDAGTSFNPCPTTAGTPCKILPLGDSITEGFGSSGGGYRVELFRQSVKNSKNLTFVGSQSNGPNTVENKPFPRNHEGHGGWTISQISGIADSTLSNQKPHIVILKIGTNDVNGTGATSAPNNLKNLINQITKDAPSALLVVSSIIPIKDDNTNQKVKTYNATIPTTVNDAAAAGKHVVFVDSYAAFVADSSWKTKLMGDNLHPNDTGYAVLGKLFYDSVSTLLPASQ